MTPLLPPGRPRSSPKINADPSYVKLSSVEKPSPSVSNTRRPGVVFRIRSANTICSATPTPTMRQLIARRFVEKA
jgi:hypothetical protein